MREAAPTSTLTGLSSARRRTAPCVEVGRTRFLSGLTDAELEQHIDDSGWAWRVAYARFQAYGSPADRAEALMLLSLHTLAVLARSPAAQAARWAEIERSLDEGVDYFQVQGRIARERLIQGAA